MPPPTDTFTDDELLQIYRNPKADLSLLAPEELQRIDALTAHEEPQKPAKTTFVDTPTTYAGGVMKSLGDTASRAGMGIVRGIGSALNPVNLITGPLAMHEDIWHNGGKGTIAGVKAIASGDPDAGGEAIGGLATALIAPRLAPKVPGAMVKTGDLLERGGIASRGISKYGVAESIYRGDPKGLAVAAAPYAVQGAGKVLAGAGEMMGGRTPPVAPAEPTVVRLEKIVAADKARAAAGKPNIPSLVKKPPTLEASLADALNEVRQADTLNQPAPSSGGSISERVARTAAARKHVDPRRVGAYEATPPDLEGDTLQGTTAIRRVDEPPAQTGRIVKSNRMLPEPMQPVAAHTPSVGSAGPRGVFRGRYEPPASTNPARQLPKWANGAPTSGPDSPMWGPGSELGGGEHVNPSNLNAEALHKLQLELDRERGAALGRILERLAKGGQ